MNPVFPAGRTSASLVSLNISILFVALAFGILPDPQEAILERRKAVCEALSIYCSLAAQRHDVATMEAATAEVVRRNTDVLSSAVRRADGIILAKTGNHEACWGEKSAGLSSVTKVQVPIALGDKPWGTVELCFRPLPAASLWCAPRHSLPYLIALLAVVDFLAYYLYLRILFRRARGGLSNAVPQRVRAALDSLAEGVLILDKDQRIAMANQAFTELVGQPLAELQGRSAAELPWRAPPTTEPGRDYPWARAANEGAPQVRVVMHLQADPASPYTLSVNATPILGDDGAHRGTMATFDNLTELERKNTSLHKVLARLKQSRTEIRLQNQKLKALAVKDPLTGCFNRRTMLEQLESFWNSATRYGHPLSCIMVDIDHFKSINDRHGHSTGDQVLQQVAETLKTTARKNDIVCRYGGEEFCVLLPHVDTDEATQAGERFRRAIESKNYANLSVTASLGVSALSLGAATQNELMDQADKALYAAKRGGRNRVVRWDMVPRDLKMDHASVGRTQAPRDTASDGTIPFHAVTALVSALSYRHADTAEHSRRVADLCVLTANGLMSRSDCYVLEVAALLHDIGKLGVPDAVLLKPGPLTEQEWQVIRSHDHISEEIITAAFTSSQLSAIIKGHHCWYGGNPHKPSLPVGQDIPLGARILTIADAFDAMVSDRVYRPGRSPQAACAELRRCAPSQFDPGLVERFIGVVLAHDESRRRPTLLLSKQTALKIGLEIEKLASAMDAQDMEGLALMAGRLSITAREHGITPIAEAAARLERPTAAGHDRVKLMELTIDLMDLCRSTYGSYLTNSQQDAAMPTAAELEFALSGSSN